LVDAQVAHSKYQAVLTALGFHGNDKEMKKLFNAVTRGTSNANGVEKAYIMAAVLNDVVFLKRETFDKAAQVAQDFLAALCSKVRIP
jgi:hypothetical protein